VVVAYTWRTVAVHVSVPSDFEGAEVFVDGRRCGPIEKELGLTVVLVRYGSHDLAVRSRDGLEFRRHVEYRFPQSEDYVYLTRLDRSSAPTALPILQKPPP